MATGGHKIFTTTLAAIISVLRGNFIYPKEPEERRAGSQDPRTSEQDKAAVDAFQLFRMQFSMA